MTLQRAQILLEAEQHRQLERRARDSGRSISEIVRESVDEYLARRSGAEALARTLAALDALSALRGEIRCERGEWDAEALGILMDEVREERDMGLTHEDDARGGIAGRRPDPAGGPHGGR